MIIISTCILSWLQLEFIGNLFLSSYHQETICKLMNKYHKEHMKWHHVTRTNIAFGVINSSQPSAAHLCKKTGSTLAQIMAYHQAITRINANLLLIGPCGTDFSETKIHNFYSRKCIWKYRLRKWRPLFQGEDELKYGTLPSTAMQRPWLPYFTGCAKEKMACPNNHLFASLPGAVQ